MPLLSRTFPMLLLAVASTALAGDPFTPDEVRPSLPEYDGIQAGIDAYYYHEAARRRAFRDQLYLNESMRSYYLPYPESETVYHRPPFSLERAYSRGGGIFSPWPIVEGDIWGYRNRSTVAQPIGRVEFQTSPTHWESHPVYARPPVEFAPTQPEQPAPRRSGPRAF